MPGFDPYDDEDEEDKPYLDHPAPAAVTGAAPESAALVGSSDDPEDKPYMAQAEPKTASNEEPKQEEPAWYEDLLGTADAFAGGALGGIPTGLMDLVGADQQAAASRANNAAHPYAHAMGEGLRDAATTMLAGPAKGAQALAGGANAMLSEMGRGGNLQQMLGAGAAGAAAGWGGAALTNAVAEPLRTGALKRLLTRGTPEAEKAIDIALGARASQGTAGSGMDYALDRARELVPRGYPSADRVQKAASNAVAEDIRAPTTYGYDRNAAMQEVADLNTYGDPRSFHAVDVPLDKIRSQAPWDPQRMMSVRGAMSGGAELPPVRLSAPAGQKQLEIGDGIHRIAAAREAGLQSVPAIVAREQGAAQLGTGDYALSELSQMAPDQWSSYSKALERVSSDPVSAGWRGSNPEPLDSLLASREALSQLAPKSAGAVRQHAADTIIGDMATGAPRGLLETMFAPTYRGGVGPSIPQMAGRGARYLAGRAATSPAATLPTGAAAWAAGNVGGAAAETSKAQAQDEKAYASGPTAEWAMQSVLSSGNSGLDPQDEQRLTEAVMSGDAQRLYSMDFQMRMKNPAYARRMSQELESLSESY